MSPWRCPTVNVSKPLTSPLKESAPMAAKSPGLPPRPEFGKQDLKITISFSPPGSRPGARRVYGVPVFWPFSAKRVFRCVELLGPGSGLRQVH